LFINLTPFVPLSILGEGEGIFREGLRPSLTCTLLSFTKGMEKYLIKKGEAS